MDGKMRHGRCIYVLGDVHGSFNGLNSFINKRIRQDKALRAIAPYWKRDGDDFQVIILQCGDFAYFWPMRDRPLIQNRVDWLANGHVPVYWIGGNHDDWDRLNKFRELTEVTLGVFYCPFGSTLTLSPDITVLFAGGAESADKDWRLEEMSRGAPKIWWEQEGISKADMERLSLVPKADWVVSHTAPGSFDVESKMRGHAGWMDHVHEPSRLKLEQVLVKYKPKRWFFGHYHHQMSGFTDGCEWECLPNLDGAERSWNRIWIEWVN